MTKRSVVGVILLSCFTMGIYQLIWTVKTKNEMNTRGANIPTAWLLLVPIANLYWMWKYCEGVGIATNGKMSAVTALVMMMFLGPIATGLIQSSFNDVAALPPGGMARAA